MDDSDGSGKPGKGGKSGTLTQNALAKFYEAYRVMLFRFVLSYVRNEEVANDIASTVWLWVVLYARAGSKPFHDGHSDSERKVWIFRRAKWCALNYLNRQRKFPHDPLNGDGPDLDPPVPDALITPVRMEDQVAEREVILRAMDQLSARNAAAVHLRKVFGLSMEEITAILGFPTKDATKHAIARAIRQLRAAYFKQDQGPETRGAQ